MTTLLPTAEHVLELGIRRAITLVREGRGDDAMRTLLVAGSAAELIQMDADDLVTDQLLEGGFQ
jgi:hypothetical protein